MNLHEFAVKHDLVSKMMVDPVGYLTEVFGILKGIHEELTKSEEKKSTGVEKAAEIVSQDETIVEVTAALAARIREAIFSTTDEHEMVAILLPKVLDEIRKEVVAVRSVAMMGIEIPDVDNDEDDDDSELIEEALCAAQILEEQPVTVLGMVGKTLADLPEKMVKKSKTGEVVSVKLPHGFSASSLEKKSSGEVDKKSGPGRPLATSNWTFTLDGEKLPTVPLEVLALKFCSTWTERVSSLELKEWYKNRTGQDFPAPPASNTVEMRVPKGILVGTFAPKK